MTEIKMERINRSVSVYCYKEKEEVEVKEYKDNYGKTVCKEWRKEGKLHRDGDLPAVEYIRGSKQWWKNGVPHRDGDLPAVIYANGRKEWWKHGKRHRDNGPALEDSKGKYWFKEGKRHRDNGPAIEYADGEKVWIENDVFIKRMYALPPGL